jgi:hypothetical protein
VTTVMPKIAINGLCRIGRAALKALVDSDDLELVARLESGWARHGGDAVRGEVVGGI